MEIEAAIRRQQREAAGLPEDIPSALASDSEECRWCGSPATAILPVNAHLPIAGANALPLCSGCMPIKVKSLRAVRPTERREPREESLRPERHRRRDWRE